MPGIFPLVIGGSGGVGGGGAFDGQAMDTNGGGNYNTRSAAFSPAVSDTDAGTVSFWFNTQGTFTGFAYAYSSGFSNLIFNFTRLHLSSGEWQFTWYDSSGTTMIQCISNSVPTGSGWHHYAVSVDRSSNLCKMYLDGSSDGPKAPGAYFAASGNIDYSSLYETRVGGGFDGFMAEFWMHNEYIDLSTASNLQKFRSATGYPVNLGSDGSTPTGTTPIIYNRLTGSDSISAWLTNQTGRGNFTDTGTQILAASDPFP